MQGGGSANKTSLFQQTKALLNPASLTKFIEEKIKGLGTAACPPYHLAFVIGGTSAEHNLKVRRGGVLPARPLGQQGTSHQPRLDMGCMGWACHAIIYDGAGHSAPPRIA